MAGHLGVLGNEVKLFDVVQDTVDAINELGGIEVTGAVNGFGKIELATTNIEEVIKGRDIIVVVLPSLYHESIARKCAPYLEDGQIVVLHPSASFAAFEFKRVLEEEGCTKDVIIAETSTLLYACRAYKPGFAEIYGVEEYVSVAALPANKNDRVMEVLNTAFTGFKVAKNVIQSSLENVNAMVHPGPTILNTSKIEGPEGFLYYIDGVTPSIAEYVDKMDQERLAIAKAVGLEIMDLKELYVKMYNAKGDNLYEIINSVEAYRGVNGQKSLRTRYLLEDIHNSLQPIASLGKKLGIKTDRMDAIINLCKLMLEGEFIEGRTVDSLGIADLSVEELLNFVDNGVKPVKVNA
ncbi:MAG: NAD/NADP octopine/nopaline dehydrogenase family protein [Paraclostridium sp.]